MLNQLNKCKYRIIYDQIKEVVYCAKISLNNFDCKNPYLSEETCSLLKRKV